MNQTVATFRQSLFRAASPAGRFLLGLLVFVAADILADGFAPGNPSSLRFDIVARPLLVVLLLLGFSLLLVLVDRAPGNPLASMGLGLRGPWLSDTLWGLLLGTGMVGTAVGIIAVAGHITVRTRLNSHNALASAGVLVILLTGAMAEELAFRGYPFQRLVDAFGPVAAVVVFSVLFGAAHLGNPNVSLWGVANTVLVGILLALAYLRTRSLWLPWGIHFSWNAALGLGFGLPVSGLTKFSVLVRSRAQGPLWLTGGSYGIEASAIGACVILGGIVLLLVCVRQRELVPPATEEPAMLGLGTGN